MSNISEKRMLQFAYKRFNRKKVLCEFIDNENGMKFYSWYESAEPYLFKRNGKYKRGRISTLDNATKESLRTKCVTAQQYKKCITVCG